ncbi:MAG: hypothetical protein Kow0069_26830 [Promethearchaeota archaeon]
MSIARDPDKVRRVALDALMFAYTMAIALLLALSFASLMTLFTGA